MNYFVQSDKKYYHEENTSCSMFDKPHGKNIFYLEQHLGFAFHDFALQCSKYSRIHCFDCKNPDALHFNDPIPKLIHMHQIFKRLHIFSGIDSIPMSKILNAVKKNASNHCQYSTSSWFNTFLSPFARLKKSNLYQNDGKL